MGRVGVAIFKLQSSSHVLPPQGAVRRDVARWLLSRVLPHWAFENRLTQTVEGALWARLQVVLLCHADSSTYGCSSGDLERTARHFCS